MGGGSGLLRSENAQEFIFGSLLAEGGNVESYFQVRRFYKNDHIVTLFTRLYIFGDVVLLFSLANCGIHVWLCENENV